MAKKIINLKNKLMQLRLKNNLLQKVYCSREESEKYIELLKNNQPLPKGVYQEESDVTGYSQFYTIYEANKEMTPEEIEEYFLLKQSSDIRTIRNCVIFFTVLIVIVLIIGFIGGACLLNSSHSLSSYRYY